MNTTTSSTVREAIAAHDGWLAMRKSAGTRDKYAQHLRALETWAGDRPIPEVTASELEFGFLGPWGAGKTPATIRNRMAALKSLFAFCERFDIVEKNPMRRIEAPARDDHMGNWLRPKEDAELLEAVASPDEKIIVWLLRFTGLRVSEACSLEWGDIDFTNQRLTVRKSKTASGRRTIPLHPMLVPALHSWQGQRPGLFVLATKNGTAMAHQHVWKIVKRVGLRIGVVGLSPHSLRRTFGSAAINEGIRLEVVSKLLGHSNTAITEKAYAALEAETIAAEALTAWGGGSA